MLPLPAVCFFCMQIVLVAPLTPATSMTDSFTPLLILLLALSYLLMVYFVFAVIQRVVNSRKQMLK